MKDLMPTGTDNERDDGNSGSSKTIDLSTGRARKLTMTANCVLTLTNAQPGWTYFIRAVQNSTGNFQITWPSSAPATKWPSGTTPTQSGANKVDLFSLYFDGTNFYGGYSLNY